MIKLFNQQTLERLSDMHGKIQKNQARIATEKILSASDDPIAAVNISIAKEQKTENARYLENIGRAKSKLELSEGALDKASNLITRIYELTILAENDTFTSADRIAMKHEITQLKDFMFEIAIQKTPQVKHYSPDIKSIRMRLLRTKMDIFNIWGQRQ